MEEVIRSRTRSLLALAWVSAVLVSACGGSSGESPASPSAPTAPTVQPPESLALNCNEWSTVSNGSYLTQNNVWGKGSLTGWSQCVGIGAGPNDSVSARFTWDWPTAGGNVKAYPEVIYGFKPAMASSTSSSLPKIINTIQELSVTYDLTSTHTGSGNTAFDIWLTNTATPSAFSSPPISHEVMIWLESWGALAPGGSLIETATIAGKQWRVYLGENFGNGWRYIAFKAVSNSLKPATLDIKALLSYAQLKGLISGREYVSSIEFGNEIVAGTGDTKIKSFSVQMR